MYKRQASTLQGEVIRISGKLSQEILDNGKMNWDKEYLQMVQALLGYLSPVSYTHLDVYKRQVMDMSAALYPIHISCCNITIQENLL